MSSTLTFESSRFGTLQVAEADVIEFPHGLIGLGGRRYAVISRDRGAVSWLPPPQDPGPRGAPPPPSPPGPSPAPAPAPAGEGRRPRLGIADPAEVDVWVTVRAGA